jgi:membrane protease subunit HflC
MRRNPLILIIGIVLVVIFFLLLFTFQVRQSEVVMVTTFGRPSEPYTKPGIYLRWPWGIQMVHRFDQRVQNFEDQLSEGLTRDGKNLITSVYVGWKITEPARFFAKFGAGESIPEAEKYLKQALVGAKSAVVGMHPLVDFVSASDNGTNYLAIENQILEGVRNQVQQAGYGMAIEFLGIKRLAIPDQVTQQVFDEMTKERQVLVSASEAEGAAEASKIKSQADRTAAEMLAKAEGEATQIRGTAQAEAGKYLTIFKQDEGLANFIFRLDALEGTLKERSILIFDRRTPPFDLFNGNFQGFTNKLEGGQRESAGGAGK